MISTTSMTRLFALTALLVLTACTGCDNDSDGGGGPTYLRAGKKVSSRLSGWVAVPGAEPKVTEDKDKGVSYSVLGTHQIVPYAMNQWKAYPPKLFKALSHIAVQAPEDKSGELYVLHQGEHVPYEMSNWIAVPNTQPQIEVSTTQKDKGVALLSAGNIIPKEMNGWVAIDNDTSAKLIRDYEMTGRGSK